MAKKLEPRLKKTIEKHYREAARDIWQKGGEIEVDDDAKISFSRDDGAYVQAWVWVDRQQTSVTEAEHKKYV